MRRAAPLALALPLLLAGPTGAQEAAPHARVPGVPDVPPGPGTLRGRVVHASRPEAAAGLPVVLYALPPEGQPGLRGGVTDARGGFAFESVSNDPATPYLVGVSFADIPFGTRIHFPEGALEQSVVVEISDPSDDVSAVERREVRLRLERSCGGLRVVESHALGNPTGGVISVAAAAREAGEPVLEAVLPPGATGVGVAPGKPPVETEAGRVRYWGPLYPGSQSLEFSYGLPAEEGRVALALEFPGGAERVVVATHADGPAVRGEGLRPGPDLDEEGGSWHTAVAQDVAPGGRLSLSVALPAPAPAAAGLELVRAQMWLELDEAALQVNEQYALDNPATQPLRSASDAPLLCLPLPDGAQQLRFSSASLAMGLEPDPSGALAVRGPLPPGSSTLALGYLLPHNGDSLSLARRFPLAFPWLSVYLADTGIVADSPRLHRRRPVLAEDRTYLHFEAFQIGADESVELSLSPLPAQRRTSRLAVAVFLALAAAGSLWVLTPPLWRSRSPVPEPETSDAAFERESIYAAIRDLDHDFETGKLSEEDYESFRRELRGRAVALLRAERLAAAPPEPTDAARRCPACGAEPDAEARFCSRCGAALDEDARRGGRGA